MIFERATSAAALLTTALALTIAGPAVAQPTGQASAPSGRPASEANGPREAVPAPGAPQSLLPPTIGESAVPPVARRAPAPTGPAAIPGATPVIAPQPIVEPVMSWSLGDARSLLDIVESSAADGLIAADYNPVGLRAAIAEGPGDALDQVASKSFAWLAEDRREGRTPVESRVQWFAVDTDREATPTAMLMAKALADHDISGVLASLDPTVPDYATLRQSLADTPASDRTRRALIRANMDRWRWLARDLGDVYLLTNVPEFQLRLTVKNRIIRSYRTVVGKPGKTATPQLAETVQAVVFNPTWTVPQSIVKGEGLGAKLVASPGSARAQGYKVTRSEDGTIYVVQQPGDSNALGRMKIDMPNPHAIYLHDTPQKALFAKEMRAFSHGCIRTENARVLGMTMAMLGAGMDVDRARELYNSATYTRVPMTRTFPVYITYFTIASDIAGAIRTFPDIYARDAPVLASFRAPREQKTDQRVSDEPVIKLDNPL